MVPWKLIAMIVLFVLPGGSLLLLALATAKALGSSRQRSQGTALPGPQVTAALAPAAKA